MKSPVKRLAVVAAIVLSLSACTSGTAETEADVPAEDSNLSMAEAAEAKSSETGPYEWEDDTPYDPDTDPYAKKATPEEAAAALDHLETMWVERGDTGAEFWCGMWEDAPNDVLEHFMANVIVNDPEVVTKFMNDNCE